MVHTSTAILAAIALNIVPILAAPIVRSSNQLTAREETEKITPVPAHNRQKKPGHTGPIAELPSRRDVEDNLQMFTRDIGEGVKLFARDRDYLYRKYSDDFDYGGSMHRLHKSDLTVRGQISPVDKQEYDHDHFRLEKRPHPAAEESSPLGRRDGQDESQIFARGSGGSRLDADVRGNDHLRRDLPSNGIPAPGGPPGHTLLKREIDELD